LEDFNFSLISKLQELSEKHDFVYFEDRKFADIGMPLNRTFFLKSLSQAQAVWDEGNTVSLQYSSGVHKIASWSHITNAHSVPGPSIVQGLAKVGLPLGRGLLLLAEMSTKGNLAAGAYTDSTVQMARQYKDFVIGFIAQRRMEGVGAESFAEDEDFLILTPGVGLESKGDSMGQQYRTPREVILEAGCDVIIVGRGIYGNDPTDTDSIRKRAEIYRTAGWNAYLERTA
jgi:orotidine-5'-phosphate decarboxylase